MDECHFLGRVKCHRCGKPGHSEDECWFNKNQKDKRGNKGDGKGWNNKPKKEEANVIEEVAFITDDTIQFNPSEDKQYFNFGNHTVSTAEGIDERVIYYDWFADSATSSHISNQHEAFTTFKPLSGKSVAGVGRNRARVEGWGTIELESTYEGSQYLLRLEDVLYIPSNRNNLILLRHLDTAGGQYIGGRGVIKLITKDGTTIAKGTKINNNLYKMDVTMKLPAATKTLVTPQTFTVTEPAHSWETWH
jgi:hypothetical protein